MHSSILICEIKIKKEWLWPEKYLKYLTLFDFCKTDIMLGMQILKNLEEGVRKKFMFIFLSSLSKLKGYLSLDVFVPSCIAITKSAPNNNNPAQKIGMYSTVSLEPVMKTL